MNRRLFLLPMAAVLLTTSPAFAQRYGYCVVTEGGTNYGSGVVDVPEADFDAFQRGTFPTQFLSWLVAGRGIDPKSPVRCYAFDRLADARNDIVTLRGRGGRIVTNVATGYRGDFPDPAAAAPAAAPSADDGAAFAEPAVDAAAAEAEKLRREAEEAERARARAEVDAAIRAANAGTQSRYEAERIANAQALRDYDEAVAENGRAIDRYNAALAETERRRAEEMADWERRVALCRAGDVTQCSQPAPAPN